MPKEIRSTAPSYRTLPYPTASSSSTVAPAFPTAPSSITPHPAISPPPSVSGRTDDRQPSAAWPKEKDELLMRARQQGLNWHPIADQYFPGKSANACRKRHERLMEKRNSADDWDSAKMEALSKAYNDVREQMWRLLANRIGGEKWQVVESKCMEKGLKTLQTAGRTASRRDRNQQCGTSPHSHSAGGAGGSPDFDYVGLRLDSSRECSKSHGHSDIDDSFNDSAIGPEADLPFSNGVQGFDDSNITSSLRPSPQSSHQALHGHHGYPTPSRGHTPPHFPPPSRTFSNASSSALSSTTGFTPTMTAAPSFPSQIQPSTPSFPSQLQSRERQNSTVPTLPSFRTAFGQSGHALTRGS